jgi:DNA-3-methyladenine glycosylase II
VKDESVMTVIARRLLGLKTPTTPTVFEALVDTIVEQQISMREATSIEKRILLNSSEECLNHNLWQ